jgi:steroid 5-alpha reductase family enzyme
MFGSVAAVVAALVGAGDSGRRVLLAVLLGLWGLRLGTDLGVHPAATEAQLTTSGSSGSRAARAGSG